MQKLRPIVDADYIAYRIGFAVNDTEPVEFALASARSLINNIWGYFGQKGTLYLTGSGNYREKLATILPYKGHRDPSQKPFYYDDLKRYVLEVHNAVVVDGIEADDAVGIEQYGAKNRDTCIVGVDKDLLCIPGHHFNPVKKEQRYVTLAEANYNFWTQVLTGDKAVDNVRGIEGCGPKTAKAILDATDKSWIEMHNATLKAYEQKYKGDGYRQFRETATLIWIQRKAGLNYDDQPIPETLETLYESSGRDSGDGSKGEGQPETL